VRGLRQADDVARCRPPGSEGLSLRALPLLFLTACAAAGSFTPRDRQAITAVLRDQEDAWNRGDLEAFMAGYARSPDLVFTSGGRIRRGWDETFAKYRARYGADKSTMGRLRFEILEVTPLGADGAIVLGRWRLTETPQAGAGIFSLALARLPEGWRVVHDHTSSDESP
jgi:ketosteroid isomerase-like protein